VNELFRKIQNDGQLKDKIKLIGIGAKHSPVEVDRFRKTYDVPFPLFADGDGSIQKRLGEQRLPFFIAARVNADGTARIFMEKLGRMSDPDRFLASILKASESN
jgi:hypothetical protein